MCNNIWVQGNNNGCKNGRAIIRIATTIFILVVLSFSVSFSLIPSAMANTLPNYLQGGGDAVRTLGNFINNALSFLTALLWGIWTIIAVLFAKDLMMGHDAEALKTKVFKLGAAALILLMITALPTLFAGFAN